MKRLLAGPRAVEEALHADPTRVVVVYATAERLRELDALVLAAIPAAVT